MTITSKFQGKCLSCGGRIEIGEQINWERGVGSSHIACPANPAPEPAREKKTVTVGPGVYEKDGNVYIVKPNKEKTRLYAKRLVEINADRLNENDDFVNIEFEYDRGAIFDLEPADQMDVERAKALTLRYRRCIVCGIKLKAAKSVEQGIGPVCIKSFRGLVAA